MKLFNIICKRKRIETLVVDAIDARALSNNRIARTGLCIADLVRSFSELWPSKYFDLADDRRIAGLVIAYMVEILEIELEDLNENGRRLLEFSADLEPREFQDNAPHTYAQLDGNDTTETAATRSFIHRSLNRRH